MQSRSVAHALSWSAFAQIGGAVALIVGTRLLTTFVSPAVFGVVALTTGASTLMSSTFCLPILHVAGRLYPERELAGRGCVIRRATTQLILAASVFPAFIVLVLGSAYAAQGRTSLMTVIAVAFLVIVEMQRATAQTMLAAARLQREQALWAFVEQVLRPLLAVAVVLLFGDQSWLVVAAFALATAVAFVGSRFAHADTAETSSAELAAERRRLVRYAAPLLPQAWHGTEAAGMYAAVYGVVSRPFIMLGTIGINAFRPAYFQQVSANDSHAARRTLAMWIGTQLAISTLGLLLLITFQNQLLPLALAPHYAPGFSLTPWIASGYVLLTLGQVFQIVSLATYRTWGVTAAESVGAAASLVVGIPLIMAAGIRGAAWAVPAYFGAQLICSVVIASRTPKTQSTVEFDALPVLTT